MSYTLSDIYGVCVGLLGISPGYYLDEMSQGEVVAVMKARQEHYNLVSRDEWEQTRLQCFYSVAAMGGKVKKPRDLFKFPWDGEKRSEDAPKTQKDAMKKLLSYGTKKS